MCFLYPLLTRIKTITISRHDSSDNLRTYHYCWLVRGQSRWTFPSQLLGKQTDTDPDGKSMSTQSRIYHPSSSSRQSWYWPCWPPWCPSTFGSSRSPTHNCSRKSFRQIHTPDDQTCLSSQPHILCYYSCQKFSSQVFCPFFLNLTNVEIFSHILLEHRVHWPVSLARPCRIRTCQHSCQHRCQAVSCQLGTTPVNIAGEPLSLPVRVGGEVLGDGVGQLAREFGRSLRGIWLLRNLVGRILVGRILIGR